MGLRYVLGPVFAAKKAPAVVPGAAPAKLDVAVTVSRVDEAAGKVYVLVPAHDLATHNEIGEVRVYLLSPADAQPLDGQGFVDSHYPNTTAEVSGLETGSELEIPLPEVAPGDYQGRVVIGFKS